MNERLTALSRAGVSIWLDDLSRERLSSGNLSELIEQDSVVGVTTNPTIFAGALSHGDAYAQQLADLKHSGASVDEAVTALTTDDVRSACDLFLPLYEQTKGFDGRVSIEVDPRLARDTDKTIQQAARLHELVNRPNVLIKIPATEQGLPAITATIAAGISVNATLIFSIDRYREVFEAYMAGLEQANAQGQPLDHIHSVASFFVSRVDTEVDQRLDALGGEAAALKGQAAVANARLAFELFEQIVASERWQKLAAASANVQRPLWASTGTKNAAYSDVLYVADLITEGVVNTMPEKTLQAFADHGEVSGDTIRSHYAEAHELIDDLKRAKIDMADVFDVLEAEGVDKFVKSWDELLQTVDGQLSET